MTADSRPLYAFYAQGEPITPPLCDNGITRLGYSISHALIGTLKLTWTGLNTWGFHSAWNGTPNGNTSYSIALSLTDSTWTLSYSYQFYSSIFSTTQADSYTATSSSPTSFPFANLTSVTTDVNGNIISSTTTRIQPIITRICYSSCDATFLSTADVSHNQLLCTSSQPTLSVTLQCPLWPEFDGKVVTCTYGAAIQATYDRRIVPLNPGPALPFVPVALGGPWWPATTQCFVGVVKGATEITPSLDPPENFSHDYSPLTSNVLLIVQVWCNSPNASLISGVNPGLNAGMNAQVIVVRDGVFTNSDVNFYYGQGQPGFLYARVATPVSLTDTGVCSPYVGSATVQINDPALMPGIYGEEFFGGPVASSPTFAVRDYCGPLILNIQV